MSDFDHSPLIRFEHMEKVYRAGKRRLHALTNINLAIAQGETLGVVGESGCGKSTLGKLALGLETPSQGRVYFQNKELSTYTGSAKDIIHRQMQMIFQDPYSSLNPRMTVEQIVGEGIDIHKLARGSQRNEMIQQLLTKVALDPSMLERYPHEFSGGQRQRIVIARALAVNPIFLVCDEPLSALDACIQQQVMELLITLKQERQLTYLFISHDLHAVRQIADQVVVMYLGQIVEKAPASKLFGLPLHPYTQALLSAVPVADPVIEKKRSRLILQGELPSPLNPPHGCPFHPRCPKAMPICKTVRPELLSLGGGHSVACHAVA